MKKYKIEIPEGYEFIEEAKHVDSNGMTYVINLTRIDKHKDKRARLNTDFTIKESADDRCARILNYLIPDALNIMTANQYKNSIDALKSLSK